MAGKRKRRWALYQSMSKPHFYYIQEDWRSPLWELRGLEHCTGIYKTFDEALYIAERNVESAIVALTENLKALRRRRPKKEK